MHVEGKVTQPLETETDILLASEGTHHSSTSSSHMDGDPWVDEMAPTLS